MRPRRIRTTIVAPSTEPRRLPAAAGAAVVGPRPTGRAALLLALQRQAGNRAVAALVTAARPTPRTTAAGGVTLHGETSGEYDGGTSTITNRRARRAATCTDCPPEQGCVRATGTLAITYHVTVHIRMPDVPGDLTPCQRRRAQAFLRDVLGPHENDHARRLRTYDGTTRRAFDITGCGTSEVQEKLQAMHETEAEERATKADALSAAIDPFTREFDLDCE